MITTTTTTPAPAIRLRGHARESIAVSGGLIGSCSCGATLSPRGCKGQTGRAVDLGLFTGYAAREALREAHEAHKAAELAALPTDADDDGTHDDETCVSASCLAQHGRDGEPRRAISPLVPVGGVELGEPTGHVDTHRVPIHVGDRVIVVAYGFGARRADVRLEGRVVGSARTRVRVEVTNDRGAGHDRGTVLSLGGDVLAVLERSDATSSRQQGVLDRQAREEREERDAAPAPHTSGVAAPDEDAARARIVTMDHTPPCAVPGCGRGAGDLVHATGQHEYRTGDGLVHLMSDDLLDACGTAARGGLTVAPFTTPDAITCPRCRELVDAQRRATVETDHAIAAATGPTMPRSLRIPDAVWQAALERARANGTTLTSVVVAHLEQYATQP